MSASKDLTPELRAEVSALEADLRERLDADAARVAEWRALHDEAVKRGRTAATWHDWQEERITLAAVAWVLLTVFVRFCEDNDLVAPVWISGPTDSRRQEALDRQAEFIREKARTEADVTDRDWLKDAAAYLATLPATRALVDEHSALWLVEPSGDACARLLAYWRERGEDGRQLRDLADPSLDTRFLGDLYQDLSEWARNRYALLQTPVFVEEFILDRTLTPALAERPLDGFKLIDPTCGSGHFLLGAFRRLLDRWHAEAPAWSRQDRVQKALDAIYGVDLNPFAVAITRFRLTVAALRQSGLKRLEEAPGFRYHVAVGDSLLHGAGQQTLHADADVHDFAYATEDLAALETVLDDRRYDVVVGNPPYITVKDKALNAEYRNRYTCCKGKYSLTVPFMERFFVLAKTGERAGWVGQITSNSFMKREFGAPLIEEFLPKQDLVLAADTSGAYIPGHGTPTVIIVGRHSPPERTTVRAVLGIRGEPGRPEDAAKGKVWTSIAEHVDDPGWTDEWISVADLDRGLLAKHPWSLSGGGAVELLQALDEAAGATLDARTSSVGITSFTLEDDVFVSPRHAYDTRGIDESWLREMVLGDGLRDWTSVGQPTALFPYAADFEPRDPSHDAAVIRLMWPFRTNLANNVMFGAQTKVQAGLHWFEYGRLTAAKLRTPLSIAFAEVATHNHFVLDRGGKAFKQTAPVIKLPEGVSEDDHLTLLGALNSSTACFWLKQTCHDKGIRGEGGGFTPSDWERFYQFNGSNVADLPLPASLPLERARILDTLAQGLAEQLPSAVCQRATPTHDALDAARAEYDQIRAAMVAQQEELDWEVYRLYGLIDEDLTYDGDDLPGLALGERAFEIVLARRMKAGEEDTAWFSRHGSTPITEIPARWPPAYRELVARRIELAESHPYLKLLERPEHKRRWAAEPWEKQEERALRHWLLDRLEDKRFWFDRQGRPVAHSVAQLADDVSRDDELTAVLGLWEGRFDVPVSRSLEKLVAEEAVPYLAAYRYKEPGLRKRAEWEKTWELQRREDAGEKLPEPIPVPPKYTSADFVRKEYWANRGKLDVPKERFILYPNAGRATDPTPVLGWAGWDHAQQALAIARLIQLRQDEGDDKRIVPLVAGLAELQPWIEQWHAEPDPLYGGASPAEFFAERLRDYTGQLATTIEDVRKWRPEKKTRGRPRKATPV